MRFMITSLLAFLLLMPCGFSFAQDSKVGNTYFHGDGSTSTRVGNHMFHSGEKDKSYGW